jgi:hypothetical protein
MFIQNETAHHFTLIDPNELPLPVASLVASHGLDMISLCRRAPVDLRAHGTGFAPPHDEYPLAMYKQRLSVAQIGTARLSLQHKGAAKDVTQHQRATWS